jgi:hypothetical protein
VDTQIDVVYEDDNVRRTTVRVTDLENNSSYSKTLTTRKTVERKYTSGRDGAVIGERMNSKGEKVYIVEATEDELIVKENAAISKAMRNEGLRLIPADIVDEALSTARATLADRDAQDPAAAKRAVLDAFAGLGIKPKDLEKFLKHSVDSITPAELVELRGIYTSLKEGETTWASYVEDAPPAAPAAPPVFVDDKKEPEPPKPPKAPRKKKEDAPPPAAGSDQVATPPADPPPPAPPQPSISNGLEQTPEWSEMVRLINIDRGKYLQAKLSLKIPQGPKTLDEVKRVIDALRVERQPGQEG